jgi:putative ABC transport system permease protein
MIIGTASLILVIVVGISGRTYTVKLIQGVGSNLIIVTHKSMDPAIGRSNRLNDEDVKAIQTKIRGVKSVSPQLISHPLITLDGVSQIVDLIGTTPEYRYIRNIQVLQGRFFDENDTRSREKVCLITEPLAKKLEGQPSYRDFVTFYGIQFTVIGIFSEAVDTYEAMELTENSALVPLTVLRYFKPRDTIDQMFVSAESMDLVPQISNEIQELLITRHRRQSLFSVINLSVIIKAANKVSMGLTVVLLVIAAISLVSSGVGIMNIMLITVTERIREIGIKKAIGALRRVLLLEFLAEALFLSCGGGLIGTILGSAVPYIVAQFVPTVEIRVPPIAILISFGATFLIGISFGLIPAVKASRLNPVDALRDE